MSNSLDLHISAIDTLMFRDGRPFNQADAGASEAVSVFPPYPPTIVGAVRAMLWKGPLNGNWQNDKLGNGTNWQDNKCILGPLRFSAPQLLCDSAPVYPVPLHLVEGKTGSSKELTMLAPGNVRDCDLGKVKLPEPKNNKLAGIKTIEDRWLTASGMQKVLNGELPDIECIKRDVETPIATRDFVLRDCLWQGEPRVGIGIERKTRTTSDAQLYMATHTRMQDGVSLQVTLDGYSGKFERSLQPLAGEHRMAEIAVRKNQNTPLPAISQNLEKGRYLVICLSPLVIDKLPKSGESIDGLPGVVESACIGKPVVIGGWDSQSRCPIPLRPCIPAGSVWFMQGDENLKFTDISTRIGKATEWGFGQVLIGKWQEGHNS